MPSLTVLIYWIIFPLLFPYQAITFRGQEFPANRADSLAGVVRAEIQHINQEVEEAEDTARWLDTIMAGAGDARYWKEKAARWDARRAWADSVILVKELELDGLD